MSADNQSSLQLLPERVAGKRVMMGHFKKYRLGKPGEVKRLLEAHGATVLAFTSQEACDFVLGGYQAEEVGGFRAPVVFEEELCAPEPAMGELAYFRPRLWPMLRELLTHPLIEVSWLSVGPPLAEAAIDKLQKKLKQPLPRLLREFYQQVGELRLHWYWVLPAKEVYVNTKMGSWPDAVDAHAGVINIFTLDKVLSNEWFDPQMCFALTPSQRMFDFYNDYHMMAVDLASGDDPLLLVGDDYGVSFSDYGPIRLSEYLPLLLDTYGLKDGARNGPPEEFPVDLAQKSGLDTPELIGKALNAYLATAGPIMPGLPTTEFQQRQETQFWELLDYAQQHHPEQSPSNWHHELRKNDYWVNVYEHLWLQQPRYQALLPAVRAELRISDSITAGHIELVKRVALVNNSPDPLIATGYFLTFVIGEPGQETLLGSTSAPADFRIEVAPQQRQEFYIDFTLSASDLWAALTPLGITNDSLREAYSQKRIPEARMRLVVDCGLTGSFHDEHSMKLFYH